MILTLLVQPGVKGACPSRLDYFERQVMSNPCKFQAKLYLRRDGDDDCIESLVIFVNELDPVDKTGWRFCEEWISEHIHNSYSNYSGNNEIRKLLELPDDASSYHVLFSGYIRGWERHGPDGDDYDEELQIDDGVQFVKLPDDYYKWMETESTDGNSNET